MAATLKWAGAYHHLQSQGEKHMDAEGVISAARELIPLIDEQIEAVKALEIDGEILPDQIMKVTGLSNEILKISDRMNKIRADMPELMEDDGINAVFEEINAKIAEFNDIVIAKFSSSRQGPGTAARASSIGTKARRFTTDE